MAGSAIRIPTGQLHASNRAFTIPELQRPPSLPVVNPSKSFWLDSTPDANPLAKEGSSSILTQDADICIIGSGITGVSAAYHISKILQERHMQPEKLKPLTVVVLESRDFC
jgi:hypothetical protein